MNEYRCADPLREPEQWLRHVLEGTRLFDARGRSVPEIKKLAGLAGQARTAMDALLVGFASEIDSSGTSASPQKVLQDSTRMSKRDANRMAKTAKGLEELPNVKERLASGKISLEHAGLLVNTAKETGPAAVDNNTRLLDRASETPPDLFAGEAKRFAHKVSDDHGEKLFNRQRRRRKAALWKDTESGMGRLNAELDPVRYGLVEQALQDHAEALRRADLAEAGAGGSGQARTRQQRLADALTERLTGLDALNHATLELDQTTGSDIGDRQSGGDKGNTDNVNRTGTARSGPGRARGAKPPQLVIVADIGLIDGTDPNGRCEIPGTGPVPPAILDTLTPDTKLAGMIFAGNGRPLWLGRSRRDASAHQYLAIAVRDRGCVKCGAPMHHCHIHHMIPWEHDGPTDIDNLRALCGQHHQQEHGPYNPRTGKHHRAKRPPAAPSQKPAAHTGRKPTQTGRQSSHAGRRQKRSISAGTQGDDPAEQRRLL